MTISILDAAEARRSGGVAQRADRPRQRRCAEDAASPSLVRAAVASVDLRASSDGSALTFEGIASVTEHAYEMYDWAGPYMEIVSAGAFDATLARADLDVPLVIGHDQIRRIARTTNGTLQLAAIEAGLHVLAPSLDPADGDVAYIAPKIRAGLLGEMSFAFRIDSGQWSPDYSEYRITRVDIHRGDVSIVGWGANPYTSAGVREADEADALRLATDEQIRAEQARRNPRRGMSYAALLTLDA